MIDQVHQHPVCSAIIVNGTDAYTAACVTNLGMIQTPVGAATIRHHSLSSTSVRTASPNPAPCRGSAPR